LQGNWEQAVHYHLFGPAVFVICGLTLAHLVLELATGKSIQTFYTRALLDRRLLVLGLVMLLAYQALRLYLLAQSGELALAFASSPIGQWLQ
jgi:hypothetical protein